MLEKEQDAFFARDRNKSVMAENVFLKTYKILREYFEEFYAQNIALNFPVLIELDDEPSTLGEEQKIINSPNLEAELRKKTERNANCSLKERLNNSAEDLISFLRLQKRLPLRTNKKEQALNAFYYRYFSVKDLDETAKSLDIEKIKVITSLWEEISPRVTSWNKLSLERKLIVFKLFLSQYNKVPKDYNKGMIFFKFQIEGNSGFIELEVKESSLGNFYRRHIQKGSKNNENLTPEKINLKEEILEVREICNNLAA